MKMYKLIIFAAVIFVFSFSFAGCGMKEEIPDPKREAVRYENRVFEGLAEPEILIDMDSGNIEIYSWKHNSVKLEITKRLRGSMQKDLLAKELDKFVLEYESNVDRVCFSSRYNGRKINPADVSMDVCVYIPQILSALELKLNAGKIDIYDDLRCRLILELDAVNTNIRQYEGLLTFNACTGDLSLGGGTLAKGSSIYTGMGNISINAEIEANGEDVFKTEMGIITVQKQKHISISR